MATEPDVDPAWEYNAPQFVDFTTPFALDIDDDTADAYFDIDHENVNAEFEAEDEQDQSLYEDAEATPARSTRQAKGISAWGAIRMTPLEAKRSQTPSSAKRVATMRNSLSAKKNSPKVHSPKVNSPQVAKTPRTRSQSAKSTPQPSERPEDDKENADVSSPNPKIRVPKNLVTSLSAWRKGSQARTDQQTKKRSPAAKKAALKTRRSNPEAIQDGPTEVGKSPVPKKARKASPERKKLSLEGPKMAAPVTRPHHRTQSVDNKSSKSHVASKDRKRSLEERSRPSKRTQSTGTSRGISQENKAPAKPASLKRANSMTNMRKAQSKERINEPTKKPMPQMKPKLTMPLTPSCLKRKTVTSTVQKSSEELEIERMHALRQELVRKRKMAEESRRLIHTSSGYVPIRSVNPLTKTDEFQFATDTRIKTHGMETRHDADKKDFVGGLRKHSNSESKPLDHRVTVPQPFKLTDRKRKRPSGDSQPKMANCRFTSMAEQVSSFASRTPDRFRSKPSKKEPTPPKRSRGNQEGKLTVPKTPHFETRQRSRPVTVVSQAELDEQEIEEIKNYHFKANPINERIMRSQTGIRKVPAKELTRPVGFDLETYRRGVTIDDKEEEETYEFHAKPIPRGILEGIVGLKPAKELPVTMPESPAFALKNRVRPAKAPSPELKHEERRRVRSHQALHTGVPFMPTLEHKTTEIQAFSFEDSTRQMAVRKEQKRQQVLEEERKAREFRANPLPSSSPTGLPCKQPRPATKQAPFNLEADHRGAAKAEEWSQKMEEELRAQRDAAAFKARPCTVAFKEPFIPKKSTKPLTDISDFELSTERRAEERHEWETYKAEKEQEIAVQRQAAEEQKRREEEEEVARLRQQAVHKAQAVKKFKPVNVKPSEKPLTVPNTPQFSDRLRRRRDNSE